MTASSMPDWLGCGSEAACSGINGVEDEQVGGHTPIRAAERIVVVPSVEAAEAGHLGQEMEVLGCHPVEQAHSLGRQRARDSIGWCWHLS